MNLARTFAIAVPVAMSMALIAGFVWWSRRQTDRVAQGLRARMRALDRDDRREVLRAVRKGRRVDRPLVPPVAILLPEVSDPRVKERVTPCST